ncbi:MAG: thiamine pyrophosphate-dependent enzyme [Tepidisphaeraceae bacterium]
MGVDPRFLRDNGLEVFSGNELLVKGCLETEGGVQLLTGYPGSPVAGFFDVLGDLASLLGEKGIRAFQANNEALGVAALNGAQMAAVRAICAFKSVGLHVASDALAIGNLAGAHPEGGAVVVCGDDPWCDSTQVPADSRFLLEHLRMAVVEPGDVQQVKDWVDLSFKLSRAAGLYVGYVVTTAQADGGGSVECRPNHFSALNTNQKITLETNKIDLEKVLLPPRTWQQELKMPERHRITAKAARELGLNRIIPASRFYGGRQEAGGNADSIPASSSSSLRVAPLGFIVTGMAGPYLKQVLTDIGLDGVFPILQMGLQYPTDVEIVREFSRHCRDMVVIEERRSFLEKNIRDEFFKVFDRVEATRLSAHLFGKRFPARPYSSSSNNADVPGIPETRGLNPSVLAQLLIPLIKNTHELPADLRNGRLSAEMERIRATGQRKLEMLGNVTVKEVPTESGEACASSDVHVCAEHSASATSDDGVISRTPTFCPGCPHRDSSATLLELRKNLADAEYMRKYHNREPVDLVAHGDTGCYTMLMFAPTEQLMHNYSGMGLGGGTGSGIDPFITNKQIVFMGDGTFFHSGQVAISNAIKAGQDITFIILENKTTAMTGHQEHAGTEVDLLGNRSYIQEIDQIVRGMAGTSPLTVEKVDPADRTLWKRTLEQTILRDGVKVLIADKECGITLHRRLGKEERAEAKKHGFLPKKKHMNVTPEVCEHCLECTKATACPGLITVDTEYGKKIDTDLTWCVNDGACERVRVSNELATSIQPCPSFEEVTIIRKKRKRYTLPNLNLSKLPEPKLVHNMNTPGASWRVHMSGVGGMGIGVVGAIIVRAGHREGFRVLYNEKKGLAIRNGGVYSQITWIREGRGERGEGQTSPAMSASSLASTASLTTGLIPYGRADLLLGIDVLEAARAVDPRQPFRVATPQTTSAVINLHKQPTVSTLMGKQDFDVYKLRDRIIDHCDRSHCYAKNLSQLCEQHLGSKQFVNIMMLGVAYQLGLVPVSAGGIAWAIKNTIRRETRRNIKAFNIGRRLALDPVALPDGPAPITWQQMLENKQLILRSASKWFGDKRAKALEALVQHALRVMPGLPEQSKHDMAIRIYDLVQYGEAKYAKRYVDTIRSLYRRDSADQKYLATHAAIWNLAKLMLIKDEMYVSYLLTRPEKKLRDYAKYNIDLSNGDELRYRRTNCPEIPLFGKKIRLKIHPKEWQYKLMAKFKFVRAIPGWHRKEKQFRDWYAGLIDKLDLTTDRGYQTALKVLNAPAEVTGYREIRYPKQDLIQREVESLLSQPAMEASVSSSRSSSFSEQRQD